MQIVTTPLVHLDGDRLIRHLAADQVHEAASIGTYPQVAPVPDPGKVEIPAKVAVHDLVVDQLVGRNGTTPRQV